MSANEELQNEEREVLLSIYEGDECFKQVDPKTYQYKYGETDTVKSFLLEIKWGDSYPTELPQLSMDTFYNRHIVDPIKKKIIDSVNTEAEQYLGMSMTYSLFEYVKEKFEDLMAEQPEETVERLLNVEEKCAIDDKQDIKIKERKEQLTKAQKRRQWNRMDGKGEKPRGWNWVDIVKHLSQTGGKEAATTTPVS